MISDTSDRSIEITTLYLGLMEALAGASLPAIRSALAMAVLMTGENSGLNGDDLVDWIEQTGNEAKAALGHEPGPRH